MSVHFEHKKDGTVWIHDGEGWSGRIDKLPWNEYAFAGFRADDLRIIADEMERLAKEAET